MRFLLTSIGSRGDVQPMIGLAVGLRAAGHDVVLAMPLPFKNWGEQLKFSFVPVGMDLLEIVQREPDLAKNPIHAIRKISGLLKDEVAAQFRITKEIVPGMDYVVSTGLQVAASSCAEFHGVGFSFAAFAPGLVRSTNHAPALSPWLNLPGPINSLAWWAFQFGYERFLDPVLNHERAAIGLPPTNLTKVFFGNEVVVAVDPHLSDPPENPAMPFVQTGAWLFASSDLVPAEVDAFLNAGPAPYYLGFGSVPDSNAAASTRMFVNAVRAIGGRGMISRGWANLGADPLPTGFLAVGSLPHERVFPRLAAVVHHGGAGTTQTAARAGVPQVVVPHGADQFYWAHRVHALGLGPRGIPKTALTERRLTKALQSVAESQSFARNAEALGRRLQTVDGVATTVSYLERRAAFAKRPAAA